MNQTQYLAMKLKSAEATIQRVRDLHTPKDGCTNIGHSNPESVCPECYTYCATCGDYYPCATIQTLGDQK